MKGRWIRLRPLLNWAHRQRLDPLVPGSFKKLSDKAKVLYHVSEWRGRRIAEAALRVLTLERWLEMEKSARRRYIG